MYSIHNQRGFTLLLAALVASTVLALGAAIYSIAKKQVSLSSIGRDSQFAFYAADTLAECALYWDIRQNIFSTSSPPATVSCDGTTVNVITNGDFTPNPGGSQSYTAAGTFSFSVPSDFGTLTVAVSGAGGGGGGGARVGFANGGNGTAGAASSFNGNVVGNGGGGGQGGRLTGVNGTLGTSGSASGGDTNQDGNGSTGGGGGVGSGSGLLTGGGGAGGSGGLATKQYTPSTLSPGSSISVVIGVGGTGGASGGIGASSGFPGNTGRVEITWSGGTPAWNMTTFFFQAQPNGLCANVTLTKSLVSNQVRNLIFANGFNVACSATTTSPRALQRSVQLNY